MKKMLINATRSEELRVAIIDDHTQNLLDVIVERQSYRTTVGNIYLAKVSSIEKSLGAAFINFGSDRHGFLPMKEISKEYFERTDTSQGERPNIKDLIKEGQYLMVQVEKEERGNKGAALTTFISLAGSYLVLMPNNPRAGGISRRVEGDERNELRDTLSDLALPEGMGLIVRTAGVGKSAEELEWDLNNLLKQWDAIKTASLERDPPFLIHQESDIVTRIIRDYLREDFSEIIIDNTELFEKVKTHIAQVRPDFTHKVKLYSSNTPIFNYFQIEQKIESAYQREVQLPSGGSIVIDHTEALVAIDVNSARANKGSNIEETALTTNMEAAREIAHQLRLRDIGGLVVIDFIDMGLPRNRKEVETELRNSLKLDKARTQIGNVSSRFGLLEMSRQRLRHSLGEATQVTCPRCSGWGTIRGVESLALSIIRMIEDDAVKQKTEQVQAQLPIDIATFIINEKRGMVSDIEKRHNIEVLIIPNPNLESPHYNIKRLTQSDLGKGHPQASYALVEKSDSNTVYKKTEETQLEEKPAVVHIPSQPAPPTKKEASAGLIKRLIGSLFRSSNEKDTRPTATTATREKKPPFSSKAPPHKAPFSPHKGKGSPKTKGPHTGPRSPKQPNAPKRELHISSSVADRKPTHPPQTQDVKKVTEPKASDVQEIKPVPTTPAPVLPIAATVIVPPSQKTPPPAAPPIIASDQKDQKEEVRSRTRRGTRGGRRRNNPNLAQTPQTTEPTIDTPKPETHTIKTPTAPIDLMPPFPADLEGYYKQDITRTAPKPQKSDIPQSTPITVSTERSDAPKETSTPIERQEKVKNVADIIPTQNMAPIVVKVTPAPPKKDKEEKES